MRRVSAGVCAEAGIVERERERERERGERARVFLSHYRDAITVIF
jgi:hypothetical protein